MDFLGAGVPDHFDDLPACRATDNGIVDHDDSLTFEDLFNGIQFDLDPKVADALLGLDKGPVRYNGYG